MKKLMVHSQKRDLDLYSMEVDYDICIHDLQQFSEGCIGNFIAYYIVLNVLKGKNNKEFLK